MLKKFLSGKMNCTKNALFLLLPVPAHHIFTPNLRFLYKMEGKVRLSETVCGIFNF